MRILTAAAVAAISVSLWAAGAPPAQADDPTCVQPGLGHRAMCPNGATRYNPSEYNCTQVLPDSLTSCKPPCNQYTGPNNTGLVVPTGKFPCSDTGS